MKKKIAALLEDSRLIGNSDFENLQKSHRLSKSKLQKAKSEKAKAKLALQNFAADGGKKEQDTLMALRTAFQQAKAMQDYHRLAFDLAKFRLTRWLENWAREIAEPQEWVMVEPQKEAKKAKKAAKSEAKPEGAPVQKKKTSKATAPKTEPASEVLDA